MRQVPASWVALSLLAACGQSEPADRSTVAGGYEREPRRSFSKKRLDTQVHRYSVIIGLAVCPDPTDLHGRIDRLLGERSDAPLPTRCERLRDGTIILAEEPGRCPFLKYGNWRIERATLVDGRPVWSDDLDEQY